MYTAQGSFEAKKCSHDLLKFTYTVYQVVRFFFFFNLVKMNFSGDIDFFYICYIF